MDQGRFAVGRGSAEAPDAAIEAAPGALTAVLWHGRELAEAVRSGDVMIEGSTRAAQSFLGLFPPPAPAGAT